MKESKAPALKHTLKLYHEIKHRGIKIFLVSSRRETLRSCTVDNLIHVGYHGWTRLELRLLHSPPLNFSWFNSFSGPSGVYFNYLIFILPLTVHTGPWMMNAWKCNNTSLQWDKDWAMKGTASGALLEINGAVSMDSPVQKGPSSYQTPCTTYHKFNLANIFHLSSVRKVSYCDLIICCCCVSLIPSWDCC